MGGCPAAGACRHDIGSCAASSRLRKQCDAPESRRHVTRCRPAAVTSQLLTRGSSSRGGATPSRGPASCAASAASYRSRSRPAPASEAYRGCEGSPAHEAATADIGGMPRQMRWRWRARGVGGRGGGAGGRWGRGGAGPRGRGRSHGGRGQGTGGGVLFSIQRSSQFHKLRPVLQAPL